MLAEQGLGGNTTLWNLVLKDNTLKNDAGNALELALRTNHCVRPAS